MRLALLSWPEVEIYLENRRGLIIPVGSYEQHGPTGLIGTDAICAEAIALGAGEQSRTLVGPTLTVGMAHYHLGFPGSVSLRPSTMLAVVGDIVRSLRLHGFERFFFVNGHGGNCNTLRAAFDELHANTSFALDTHSSGRLHCHLFNWWEGPRARRVQKETYGDNEGIHAVAAEIALTYFLYPDAVKEKALDPAVAPVGPVLDALDYRKRFPDGRIGSDPSPARAEHGRLFLEAAAADIAEAIASIEASP